MADNKLLKYRNHHICTIHRMHSTLPISNEKFLISPYKPPACTNSKTHHKTNISHINNLVDLGNKNRSTELLCSITHQPCNNPPRKQPDAKHLSIPKKKKEKKPTTTTILVRPGYKKSKLNMLCMIFFYFLRHANGHC